MCQFANRERWAATAGVASGTAVRIDGVGALRQRFRGAASRAWALHRAPDRRIPWWRCARGESRGWKWRDRDRQLADGRQGLTCQSNARPQPLIDRGGTRQAARMLHRSAVKNVVARAWLALAI